MRHNPHRSGEGSAALELVLAVGFLLIPAAALLAQVPRWVATGHATQTAAVEAVRQVVLADTLPAGVTAAEAAARQVIDAHGVDPNDVVVVDVTAELPGGLARGQTVTVTVTVAGRPLHVPGLGPVGDRYRVTRSATERVDDYRSFPP